MTKAIEYPYRWHSPSSRESFAIFLQTYWPLWPNLFRYWTCYCCWSKLHFEYKLITFFLTKFALMRAERAKFTKRTFFLKVKRHLTIFLEFPKFLDFAVFFCIFQLENSCWFSVLLQYCMYSIIIKVQWLANELLFAIFICGFCNSNSEAWWRLRFGKRAICCVYVDR